MKCNYVLTRTVARVLILLLLSFIEGCASGPSKAELDAEVRRLCAVDGGIKVYETVELPPEKFNQWGQINFYEPTKGEDALGAKYILKVEHHEIVRGNPSYAPSEISLTKSHSRIIRRSDRKLLGETVLYFRVGGDPPGPWHTSSFTCPDVDTQGEGALFKRIFLKRDKGG